MEAFLHPLQGLAEFEEIKKRCGANCGILNVSGCMESQKVHLMYGLSGLFPYHLILADDERNAKEIYEDYRFYDKNVYFYPAKDLLFFLGRYSRKSSDPAADACDPGTSGTGRSDRCYQH